MDSAHIGFSDSAKIPLGPVEIGYEVLDAIPLPALIKLARLSLIEELAVICAHILPILAAIQYLHRRLLIAAVSMIKQPGQTNALQRDILFGAGKDVINSALVAFEL